MDEALTGALSETNSSAVGTIASSSHHAAKAASNLVLACALLAFLAAQLLKLVFCWLKEKRWDSRRFFVSGGMPSSICATVAALATAIGLQEGARTSGFALALVFASVVMYDASGIRFHAGRQAALLNQIVVELPPEHSVPNFRPLREPLGHTPLEAHGILGITGWGFLLPCGVITSRYFREVPFKCNYWFVVHVGLHICAYTIGTVGWAIGLSLKADHFHTFRAHRIIGIIIFGLATLQMLIRFIPSIIHVKMLAFFLKLKNDDRYRHYWNIYHHFVGYTLVSLAVINIFRGFAILQPPKSWKHTYIGLLIFLASVVFLLEVYTWVDFYFHHSTCDRASKKPPLPEHSGSQGVAARQ